MSNSMPPKISPNNLRKVLNKLYDFCPSDFGAWSLACVLDNIDISKITKKELEVIYRFIDNPEHLQKPLTENVPVSKDSEIRFAYHFDNLIFLLSNLSSFEYIAPEKSKKNEKIATAIAEHFMDGTFEKYSKKMEYC